jgi:predicted HicB family RNase H-like nuclease
MAQRKIPPHKRSKAAGISLPPELIREARKQAHQQGMSLSMLVRVLLIEKLSEAAQ